MGMRHSFMVLFLLAGFGSHCRMAPAAAGGRPQLFEPGTLFSYDYETTVLMNEVDPNRGKDVGFQITGTLTVETVWQSHSSPNIRLMEIKVSNPKLSIKSRKSPTPEGFSHHTSKLEELKNSKFLLHWDSGVVKFVFINQNEPASLINLKKGIASLFQFQTESRESEESDASGICKVQYTNLDGVMIEKIKKDCRSEVELPLIQHPDKFWSAALKSKRRSIILISQDQTAVETIDSEESHGLSVPLWEEAGGTVISQQRIKLQGRSKGTKLIRENTIDAALTMFKQSSGQSLAKHSLALVLESNVCPDGTCPTFDTMVKENREALKAEQLGTVRSASSYIKLLEIAREAKKEDLIKTLMSKKNKNILLQLVDLLGAAQTTESHEAAIRVLDFKSEDKLDLNERYLWSLSLGSHPHVNVFKDLMRLMELGPYNEKLDETLVLTIASMANKLTKLRQFGNSEIERETLEMLTSKLKDCSPSSHNCVLKYIRALKNLAAKESVGTLLSYADNVSKRISVAAINAVHSFPEHDWNPDVYKIAKKIYFQLDRRYDSSARTLALDLLLRNNPDEGLLGELLLSLQSQDPTYEVKQYLMQRLMQIAESDVNLNLTVNKLLKLLNLKNYNILSPSGLSTAFTRSFMKNPSVNGSLSTIQEISGGVVKRGLVDIIVEKDGSSQSIFTLGLFAGGLGSFFSSDDGNTDDEEEVATAGMDLTVMGVQVRPFVFFTGQGELMGHVWSGTASDRTPAFQAIGLLQDHLQFIPLEAGFISEFNLQGAISFDLSGQVSFSIWNKNAESLVEKSAGLSVRGFIQVNTMFVNSQVQFSISTEVKLRMISNIDFYSNIALCLQLQQPDSTIRHNVHKVERIPGSKHRLRKSKYKVTPVPGRTYALNKKNNELCNLIFES